MTYKNESFGNEQKWAGICGFSETKAFQSAENSNYKFKILSCDSNLCNNPKKLNDLEDFLLCEEGFYVISSSSKIYFSILVMSLATISQMIFINIY